VGGQPDYRDLDRPAYARHNAALKADNLAEDLNTENLDYLDIPAFLRRQAD
jgi:cell division protein FtsZ